jgi:curli biogenesis system outer membrane secretion channel CsgG
MHAQRRRGITRQLKIAMMLTIVVILAACSGGKVMEVKDTGTSQASPHDTSEEFTGEKITVAVLDFENNFGGPNREALEGYKFGLTDMFITEPSKIKAFTVIERTRLTEVANELALTDLAALDPDTAQQVGHLLGAQVLYYGGYTGSNLFALSARLTRVETGEILHSTTSVSNLTIGNFASCQGDVKRSRKSHQEGTKFLDG